MKKWLMVVLVMCSLRALAEKELVYDISSIPDEDAEATEAYRQKILHKMSRADLIRCVLLQPTVKLSKTDNNTGYAAQYIQNPLMNLYFTRDQSITTPTSTSSTRISVRW